MNDSHPSLFLSDELGWLCVLESAGNREINLVRLRDRIIPIMRVPFNVSSSLPYRLRRS